MLDAHRLLTQPFAWEGSEARAATREIRIESLGEVLSLVSTVSLEPEPIPLDVKVVLVGERMLLLPAAAYDPEFAELFKVAADFDDDLERNPDNQPALCAPDRHAGARGKAAAASTARRGALIEHSARARGDARKLSAH